LGGFRVLPSPVEFWQESPDGLHDPIRYRREGDGWTIERLSP
jgi:pyridoxamine 5'-phosphate oxidase